MSKDINQQRSSFLLPDREEKLKRAAANRQHDLTVILENVHDPHNIGAVLRSCDAVGISEIYVIVSENFISTKEKYIGRNSASGSKKWVEIHFFTDLQLCINEVRKKYDQIFGTHLSAESHSLYDLNLANSIALMFGNEHAGLSDEALNLLDGNFIIPQFGLVQSLNISVACAISIFEAMRQRILIGAYNNVFDTNDPNHAQALDHFLSKQFPRI
ncbi:MAG: RNA methyltransferase [Saprospiraceae bacterium]